MQALLQRRATLESTLEQLVPDSPFAATVPILRCFRGVDTLTAAGLCAEIGDFTRLADLGSDGLGLGGARVVPPASTGCWRGVR